MYSLKRFIKFSRLSNFSFFSLNAKFVSNKNNNKGPDYGGLDIKESVKEETSKKSTDQAKNSFSGGMSQGQSHPTMTDQALNFMATGLSEVFRSRNHPIDELIVMDHRDLRVFLDKFEKSGDFEEASKWLHQFIWEICRHSIAEEIILYPMLKKVPNGREKWNDSLEEHRKIKQILSHVEKIKDLNQLKAKVRECTDVLMHHIEYEEKEVLPEINKYFIKQDLINEGNRFLRRKFIAPTKPHTMAPDSIPTLELLVGMLVSPIDKFRDIFIVPFPDQNEVDKIKKENTNKNSKS